MAATEERPKAKTDGKIDPKTKVLLFSIYPGLTISVEKMRKDAVMDVEGRAQTFKRGHTRYVKFGLPTIGEHFAEAEFRDLEDKKVVVRNNDGSIDSEQVIQAGIRTMEGYGRDFFECVRTPGMDPKAYSLLEYIDKNPNGAEGLFNQARAKNIYANAASKTTGLSALAVAKRCLEFEMKWKRNHGE